jgi:hypothetical protein
MANPVQTKLCKGCGAGLYEAAKLPSNLAPRDGPDYLLTVARALCKVVEEAIKEDGIREGDGAGKDLDAALRLSRRAYELDPSRSDCVELWSEIFYLRARVTFIPGMHRAGMTAAPDPGVP